MNSFSPWKILHIDLSEDIPDLSLIPGYGGIYLVFWWHGIPLGDREIFTDELPITATQLINLALQTITPAVGSHLFEHGFKAALPIVAKYTVEDPPPDFEQLVTLKPLTQLQQQLTALKDNSVSVVICTRNRPKQLQECLRSLQKLSPSPTEIVVVDNAPTDDTTREVVAQIPGIKYILETRPGLSIARNTGIQNTCGKIIAFTDDDVIVHPQWIARLLHSFADPQVMAVTGLVLPGELETPAQLIFEHGLGGFSQGFRPKIFDSRFFALMKHLGVPVWKIGAGANMAIARTAFELVGNFDERLGAGAAGCSEDSELWYRLLAQGWVCRYEPTAVVFHYHRDNLDKLQQQAYQYMRGHVVGLLIQLAKYQHWGNLRRLYIALPRYYSKLFFEGLIRGFPDRYSIVRSEILGCVDGVKFYLQNRFLNLTARKKLISERVDINKHKTYTNSL